MKIPDFAHNRVRFIRARDGVAVDAIHAATRSIWHRSTASDTSSSSSTCEPGNNSPICEKPTDSTGTETLPIVLGAVIPICCALVVFFILHRRYVKKQRQEDADNQNDTFDDFGMSGVVSKAKRMKHAVPEMTVTDAAGRLTPTGTRPRGLSVEVASPYLLPGGFDGSKESIHRMSRSLADQQGPYQSTTFAHRSREFQKAPLTENVSVYSASTGNLSALETANLLGSSQKNPSYQSKRGASLIPHDSKLSDDSQLRQLHGTGRSQPPSRKTSLGSSDLSVRSPADLLSLQERSLPSPPPAQSRVGRKPLRTAPLAETHMPSHAESTSSRAETSQAIPSRDYSHYENQPITVPTATYVQRPEESNYDYAPDYTGRFSIDTPAPSQQHPVQTYVPSAAGAPPLPPDGVLADDNPEQRANRIRSFYKEYFDDGNSTAVRGRHAEDEFEYADGAIFDPETGNFIIPGARPFGQPAGRRAMTPPPRGAPRHSQQSQQTYARAQSAGRAGPRAKRAPPPKPLVGLPTPHQLGYDSAVASPIDFAPPTSFREMQNGRAPDSPGRQSARPYGPAVRAFTPLASAYDDLVVMPSPHSLRKSGTYTGLDFAPPKFRSQDSASDAGSVRSGRTARSGISARQLDAVRAGAYRVSRIPKEVVTTKDDMAVQLRPRLDMTTRA